MNEGPKTSMLQEASSPFLRRMLSQNDIMLAVALAVVLTTLLIPLPTFLLDLLLACSIAVAISTLVIILSAQESIEFSTFPSLLLFVTLFRLSLNVASTRLILLHGDAGDIIRTFGHFVVGGQVVVGLVVFLILVIIQFVVITKGAERISEVAARFNLDAMPGKQMAIDADLNAGLIGEDEARSRRQKIVKESEFYGAMDGASKFIRGDAVAGLIITAINLVGGFVVGMLRGMSAGQSIETYAILGVGDGLVSQIPAVVIATASGFLISKTSTQASLSQDLLRQFLCRSKPLYTAAGLMGAMVLVPGFPKVPFMALALGVGFIARTLAQAEQKAAVKPPPQPAPAEEEAPVEELLDVDRICIQVGPSLIRTVDPRRKGSLSQRIAPLRRKFAQQYGIVLPLVRLRDNISLKPTSYEIRLHNHVVASGELQSEKFLAMDPGTVTNPIQGQEAKEPVFNLPALWITAEQKSQAEIAGYTVVDPETVLVTHLAEVLRAHSHELLGRDDVQKLVDRLREKQPALVNAVVGESLPLGLLQRVLQNLLKNGIPIRDLGIILESLADSVSRTKDVQMLTESARKALTRTITEQHSDSAGRILALVFEPSCEYELRNSLTRSQEGENFNIAPERAIELSRKIADAWKSAMELGQDKVVLLCDARLRPHLAALLCRQLPQLPVLAYDEICMGTKVESLATVSMDLDEAQMPMLLEGATS
ncbi:MAG: flagellar biosynthesis protein FlhA [Planctomycetes bacterium]|jgi:flagellar biosynthesis protein FlhA|nr:flagellar biosynthesis protein FlhA [Planctomycetota bacterium]